MCFDDSEALALARRVASNAERAEVWRGSRLVDRVHVSTNQSDLY